VRDARLLYSSSNGDRWLLMRGTEPDRVFVRHEPNAAFGGAARDIRIADFLIRAIYGPEHQALLTLIKTLADDSPRDASRRGLSN
jgi:hypothetical protein